MPLMWARYPSRILFLSCALSSAIYGRVARVVAVVKRKRLCQPPHDVLLLTTWWCVKLCEVKKWKPSRNCALKSIQSQRVESSQRWERMKREGMKSLRVFLCSINIECWAVFHLNPGSILGGILIVLPLVRVGSQAHCTCTLDCEMFAKSTIISGHWPLDDIPMSPSSDHTTQPPAVWNTEALAGVPAKMFFRKELIDKKTNFRAAMAN